MSAAEASSAAPSSVGRSARAAPSRHAWTPAARRPSSRFLRSELMLIFGRRRNWAGLAVLASVPIIIAVVIKLTAAPEAGGGPTFSTSITENGLFVALTALTVELPLFLPLAVAAISADSVAGEANLGTLRYLLTVPVHRTRLLATKYAAITIFALAATLLVAGVGAGLGLVLFGGGELTLLSGSQISFAEGLWRLLLVCGYIAAGLAALGGVGLFVSTLTEQPIGGTIAILIVGVGSQILGAIPQLEPIHPYLLTQHWFAFGDLLRDPIATEGIVRGLVTAGAYAAVSFAAAWARFGGRDVST